MGQYFKLDLAVRYDFLVLFSHILSKTSIIRLNDMVQSTWQWLKQGIWQFTDLYSWRRGKNAQCDILVSVTKSLGTNSVTISKIYSISFLALSSQQKKSPFCISHPIVNPVSFRLSRWFQTICCWCKQEQQIQQG